jgi:cytochrome c55X
MRGGGLSGAWAVASALLPAAALAAEPPSITPERQQQLVRMVRQDCGSCHGMQLTGGLGPALTRAALADKPVEAMAATIFHGRPGTPMPGWRPLLSETEARWIAAQLLAGFPVESRPSR